MSLTFYEWLKLSREKKVETYPALSNHDKFLARLQGPGCDPVDVDPKDVQDKGQKSLEK